MLVKETWKHNAVDLEVEAVQVTEENAEAIRAWCAGFLVHEENVETGVKQPGINVPTFEGKVRASVGAYVVKDRVGGFTVRTPSSFRSLFTRTS